MDIPVIQVYPTEAESEGCKAFCIDDGTGWDRSYGYLHVYTISALEGQGWEFVEFTWDFNYENTTSEGDPSFFKDCHTIENPYNSHAFLHQDNPLYDYFLDWASLEVYDGIERCSVSNLKAWFRRSSEDSSSEGSSEDSSEGSSDSPSDDSSEESEDGPLLYNPVTGNLRYNPLTNHLRYRHIQSS